VINVESDRSALLPQFRASYRPAVSGYRPELDAVRFLAFFLVFIHHSLPQNTVPQNEGRLLDLVGQTGWYVLTSFANSCGMGMCLFFALSAYLITMLLLQERKNTKTVSIRKFYIRRSLRIWPLYIFGIAIGIALGLAHHNHQTVMAFMWYLLFVGNVYCTLFGYPISPMGLLWSISLEEQFYLVWPWAMRLLSKRGLIICAALFIVVANITLFILGQRHADTDTSVWTNTFVQFEMFATGILLAIANEESIWNSAAIGSALALMGPVLWFIACFAFHIKQAGVNVAASNGAALMIGYGMVAFGCAAVLQGFSMIGPSWIPRWARNLGKISYGLYVYHILAMAAVGSILRRLHIGHYYVLGLVLAFPVTILAAKVSYAWLESPFLQLKRRFEIVHGRPV